MPARTLFTGITAVGLLVVGLTAGLVRARESAPPSLGGTIEVTGRPTPAPHRTGASTPGPRPPGSAPSASRAPSGAPAAEGRAVPPPRPPSADDDGDDDGDDG
jgi:hypothetical protein